MFKKLSIKSIIYTFIQLKYKMKIFITKPKKAIKEKNNQKFTKNNKKKNVNRQIFQKASHLNKS